MKKICLLLLSLVFSVALFAQDITLTFTGKTNTNGYVKLSKVVISNLTKDWEETIIYPDTTYTFKTDGISDFEKGQKLLFQNMPNPFDGETDVTIQMTETEKVYMNVFDVNGKMVLNHHQTLTPGNHTFHLHLAAPQTYIFTVKSKGRQASIKMLNLKSGGANRIEYVGADDNLKYTLKSVNNENPFDKGDDMQYVGYSNSFNEELQSDIVARKLSESETINLTFTIPDPTVTTKDVANVSYTSATFNGESVSLVPLAKRGFCYGVTATPTIDKDSVIYVETTDNAFTATASNLKDSTTYAVRAFITTSDDKTLYGEAKTFTTAKIGDMIIYTVPVTDIDFTTAVTGGIIAETGGDEVISYGICFGVLENPTILSGNVIDVELAGDTFSVKLTELYPETKYHVRAYAISAKGIFYGQDITFSTKATELPTVVTGEVSSVSMSSAVGSGKLTYDGHAAISRLGLCWSTEQNPEVKDSTVLANTEETSFSLLMKNLKASTTYFVRAFAENEKGIAYGEQKEFTTTAQPYASVVTDTIRTIFRDNATCGGEVLDDAGLAVTARGVCWSTNENPTVEDSVTVDGVGIGKFTSHITGLKDTTTYYVRAYATNETGTAYGEQRVFRTMGKKAPIIMNFQEPFNIKTRSAEAAALINYQYDDERPFEQGFVVDTLPNVTLETGTHYWAPLNDRSVLGEITDLQPGTTYYINAYAKNSVGVAYYKEERSFTTKACSEATLTTPHPYTIETISANIHVQVAPEDAGGVQILDTLGWIYSTAGDPLEDTNAVVDARGTSIFLRDSIGYDARYIIPNLKANTTYYLRLFAVTECAKSYGQIDTFTTKGLEMATVEIDTIFNVLSHEATCQTKITSFGNGAPDKNKVGLCYGTKENPEVGQNGVIAANEQFFSASTMQNTFKLTGLEQGTTYYVRAYTKTEAGMGYSDQASFTTQKLETATVSTTSASGISQTTANVGGNISYDGGATVTQRGVCYATHENPVIETDSITKNGEGTGAFQATLEGLTPSTTYYYRAYAVNSEGTAYGEELNFTTAEETGDEFVCGKSSLKDIDGNSYPTIQYGKQCWMAQNLRTTKFADGTDITYKISTSSSDSDPFNKPKPKYYDPDKTNHAEVFGYMYNYAAILNGAEPSSANPSGVQGPCPDGWHVPSVAEYNIMFDYVRDNLCTRSCPGSVAQSLASNSYWYQGTGLNAPKECTPSYEQETTNNESGFNVFPLGVLMGSAANFDGQSAYLATTDRSYRGTNPQNMYVAIHIAFSTTGYPGTNNPNFYRQTPIRCVQDPE